MNAMIDPEKAVLCVVPGNPLPQGTRAGFFSTSDEIRLRYALWPKTEGAAKGTICLVQGRTEFIEKYFETVGDLQRRGFAVATFDFRGQGGSQRLARNPLLGYVDTFEDYLLDLKDFHRQILLPECPPPFFLVGHSMGGLVGLYAAIRDRMMFDRMFLSAPMILLENMPLGMVGTARLAEALCFFGAGSLPVGRRQDKPMGEESFAANPLTSDPRRYMRMVSVLKARPDLAVGAPSIRWAAAATRAMAKTLTDDFPGAVRIPVLMLAAARDEVVSTNAIEMLGLRMRMGRHAVIPTARHELFMENDDIRSQVFAAFDAFITDQTL